MPTTDRHIQMEDGVPAIPNPEAGRAPGNKVLAVMGVLALSAVMAVAALHVTDDRAAFVKAQKRAAPVWVDTIADFFDSFDSPEMAADVELHSTIYDDDSVMNWPWMVSPMSATGAAAISEAHKGFFQMYKGLHGTTVGASYSGNKLTLDCVFSGVGVDGKETAAKFALLATVNHKTGKIIEGTWYGDFTYVFAAGGAFDPNTLPHIPAGPCQKIAHMWQDHFEANDFAVASGFWEVFDTTGDGDFCMNDNCQPMSAAVDGFSSMQFGKSVIVTAMTTPFTATTINKDQCLMKFSHDWESSLDGTTGNIACAALMGIEGETISTASMTCNGFEPMMAAAAAAIPAIPTEPCAAASAKFVDAFKSSNFARPGPMWDMFDTAEGNQAEMNGQAMPMSVMVDNFSAMPFGTLIMPTVPYWDSTPIVGSDGKCAIHMGHDWSSKVDGTSGHITCTGVMTLTEGAVSGLDATCGGLDAMMGSAIAALQAQA